MQRPLVERVDVRFLDGTARVHDHDPVAHLRDDAEVVRDEEDRRAALVAQLAQELDYLRLERHVERGRHLVGDEERRLEHERHRDHDPLPHSPRELVRVVVEPLRGVGDADPLEHRDRALAHRPLVGSARGGARAGRPSSALRS